MALIYIFQNFLSVLLLLKFNKTYTIISLALFFVIFLFKVNTFDLIAYERLIEFNDYHNYEFFFVKILNLLSLTTSDSKMIIKTYQLFMVGIALSITFFFRNQKLLILAIILSSVAFMLAVNNNLRQGTASLIILLSIISYIEGNKKLSIILLISSIGFHYSSIYFLLITISFGLVFKFESSLSYRYRDIKFNMIFIYILSAIIALSFSFFILEFTKFTYFSSYESMNLSNNNHRTKLTEKALIITILSIIVELFLKFRKINYKIDLFRFFKICFIFIILAISFFDAFDEIGSRILFFYFIIELGLLIYLVNFKFYNTTVLILLSYMFAFNVINILGGI